jgi:mannose-6-phosphate isomerase-like protein (cupin superfamily)
MVRNRQNAPHFTWGAACDGWRLVADPTLSVIEEQMPPDAAEVRHFHQHARQFFYVLSGVLTFELGNTTCIVKEGEGVEVAPTLVHRVSNHSKAIVRFLVVSSPSTDGDRIESD